MINCCRINKAVCGWFPTLARVLYFECLGCSTSLLTSQVLYRQVAFCQLNTWPRPIVCKRRGCCLVGNLELKRYCEKFQVKLWVGGFPSGQGVRLPVVLYVCMCPFFHSSAFISVSKCLHSRNTKTILKTKSEPMNRGLWPRPPPLLPLLGWLVKGQRVSSSTLRESCCRPQKDPQKVTQWFMKQTDLPDKMRQIFHVLAATEELREGVPNGD